MFYKNLEIQKIYCKCKNLLYLECNILIRDIDKVNHAGTLFLRLNYGHRKVG